MSPKRRPPDVTDAELRERMGQAGRELALRELDWKHRIDRLLDIYRTTIRHPGSVDAPEIQEMIYAGNEP